MPLRTTAFPVILLLVLVTTVAPSAWADQFYNSGGRADFIDNDGAFRAKDAPDLLVPTRLPDAYDASADTFFLACFLQARNADATQLISGIKARYTADLVVLDLATGTFVTRRVASGKTVTGDPGTAFFFNIDPSDFGAGPPDSYLALIQLTLQMKNKRRANSLTAICDSSTRLTPRRSGRGTGR